MTKIRHNELVNQVLLYLHANYEGRWWSNPTGAIKTVKGHFQRYGLVGSTDIIGHTSLGRAVYIEIKISPDKLRSEQQLFRDMVLKHGCIHITIVDDIKEGSFNSLTKKENKNE